MFERFQDPARRAVTLAEKEARSLGHGKIGTEHLLLGLLAEGEGVAAQALADMGVTLESVRAQTEQLIGRGVAFPGRLGIPIGEEAMKSMHIAWRRAAQTGSTWINTEHLLLGLMRRDGEESVAVSVISALGVDIRLLERQVLARIRAKDWHRSDDPRTPELIREELDLVELTAELLRTELAEAEALVHLRITT